VAACLDKDPRSARARSISRVALAQIADDRGIASLEALERDRALYELDSPDASARSAPTLTQASRAPDPARGRIRKRCRRRWSR